MDTSPTSARTTDQGAFLRISRRLPATLRGALKTRPIAFVAAVAAGSFVVGALVGARLTRAVALVGVGFGLSRLFGELAFAPRSPTIHAS